MISVFDIDDIKKYIFSYLRKKPYILCKQCKCVCIWDEYKPKVFNKYVFINKQYICHNCIRYNFNCKIS